MSSEESQNDQNNTTPQGGLTKNTMAASALLLILPAAIPLYFITQTDDPTVIGIFVATSAVLILLNVMMLVFISRWLKRLANPPQQDSVQD